MATYQNIFTSVQVRGTKWAFRRGQEGRQGQPFFSYWYGKIGNAQVGPIHLGRLTSIVCGLIAFEIIGLNMWASVGWDPIEFARQLPWLALERPEYGLSIHPCRRADGGFWPASS